MDPKPQGGTGDMGQHWPKDSDNRDQHVAPPAVTEPAADSITDSQSSNGVDLSDTDESLTDGVSTNDNILLLPNHTPTIPHKLEKDSDAIPSQMPNLQSDLTPSKGLDGDAPPICKPPSPSAGSTCSAQHSSLPPNYNGHGHSKEKHLASTSKSQNSLKSSATQIKEEAGDDCCVNCVLACLFCEVLSLCSAVAQCLACGANCEALCCCGEAASGGLACCTEDTCSAILDCGILEDCCQSSDCLEICLECCSMCFPA